MADKRHERGAGERIAGLAKAQHGVVSAAQLYAVGLTRDQVTGRVRQGWLHHVHRGVYAVGREDLSQRGSWLAAVMAIGDDAVLSHGSAAALLGIRDPETSGLGRQGGPSGGDRDPTHVTLPGAGTRRHRNGVILHRSTSLTRVELGTKDGIPTTAPARTLLDLATQISGRALERAVDEAERLRLCGIREILLDRHRGEPGAGGLGRIVRARTSPTPTRLELEERFLRLVRRHRLSQPLVNAPLHDLTVDFLWPAAKLVVEVDGRGSHDTHRGFQDDRDRDSLLAVHGYLTLRFTWWDVERRPAVVAHRVRRVLRDRQR